MSHERIGDRIYLDAIDVEVDHRGHGSHQASVHRGAPADLVRELWSKLTDGERLDLVTDTCRGCGTLDPKCQCWNDE